MLRKLRRTTRLLMLAPGAVWLWRQRHLLAGMAGFARTVPDRVRLGRTEEVALAAKVNLALLREPALRGASVRLCAIQEGDVVLEAAPGADAAAAAARRAVEQVPGVRSVRVETAGAEPAIDVRGTEAAGPTDAPFVPSGEPAGGSSDW